METDLHEQLWENICKVSLDNSEENHLKFKVFQGAKESIWGLVRNPENGKIIGLSRQYREFMEVDFDPLSSNPTLYFYRPKDGRNGIKERLEFSNHSIFIRSNAEPWNFSTWSLDEVFRF
jgi:hypothetical protein